MKRIMSELEKMERGETYDFSAPDVAQRFAAAHARMQRFNTLTMQSALYRRRLRELIPDIPDTAAVVPPFHCDLGYRIRLGEEVYVNMDCTFLDSGGIVIGARTKIGPNCRLYTPQHPLDYLERRQSIERGLGITIGEDCWLGGGVTVCPGVRIGDRCIIGAGSVVTRDIPDDSLAAGNPAVVKRSLRR